MDTTDVMNSEGMEPPQEQGLFLGRCDMVTSIVLSVYLSLKYI